MKHLLGFTVLLLALTTTPALGQFVVSVPGPIDSGGPIGSLGNGTIMAPYSGLSTIFTSFDFQGRLNEVSTATFGIEADFNITNEFGARVFNPSTTTEFIGSIDVVATRNGLFWASAGDTFVFEAFESADDNDASTADANWTDLEFNYNSEAVIGNAGSFIEGSFTFDTEGSAFDTEIALYELDGTLISSDDDGGTGGGLSRLTENLAAGEYLAVIGGFDSTFSNGEAFAGNGNGNFSLNINGAEAASGVTGANQFATFSVTVTSVPEPSSIFLLAGGGLVALFRRRKRSASARMVFLGVH